MSRSSTANTLVAGYEEIVEPIPRRRGALTPSDADEHWWRQQMRRERAGAYWFAAAKWGMLGLVIGTCLGAFMMYVASTSTVDIAADAVSRGQAIEAARQSVQDSFGHQAPPPAP
jgi:hypothetical protein